MRYPDPFQPFAVAAAFLVCVALIATCVGCGSTLEAPYCEASGPTTAYIVGGEPSTDRRSTAFAQSARGYCSATIIGPHTAISAGHCGTIEDLLVEGVAWFDVQENVLHPDFAFPSNDLRILHTEEVLPEPYAPLATDEVVCSSTIAQGYGYGGGGALHEREVFEAGHLLDQIFASTAIAPGDSGGALYAITADGPVLLGVSSWGWGVKPNYEGGTGFISVPFHYDWIQENIR